MASGFGKSNAIKGASGRESMYAPSEPNEVITVNRMSAGIGDKSEPTRMFYSVSSGSESGSRSKRVAKVDATHQDQGSGNTPRVFPHSRDHQHANGMPPSP
jgi:hypothetical protein